MQIYYGCDTNIDLLKDKEILFIGYGSQGRAQALNLFDSGIKNIRVNLLEQSKTCQKVIEDGFVLCSLEEGLATADIIVMAAPDEAQEEIYNNFMHHDLKKGSALIFMHGFSVHFGFVKPQTDIDVILVAPKGPGPKLRSEYLAGRGLVSLIAVAQDYTKQAKTYALAYAAGIGSDRASILETSFQEECECDLFGEQVVLCGGLSELIRMAYQTLVDAGYAPEMAYFECVHEIKLIADLIYQYGVGGMNSFISNTAEWGEYVAGQAIITDETQTAMQKILADIRSGKFAQNWMDEYRTGLLNFKQERMLRQREDREKVGKKIRALMPWINQK